MDKTVTPSLPLIVIGMVTYNHDQFISFAIESCIKQTYTNWKLCIVDDGSTDTTQAVVERYLTDSRIHYIRNTKNTGISSSRNTTVEFALSQNAHYFAVLDSDDMWEPSKLEQQITYMESAGHCGVLGTWYSRINADGTLIEKRKTPSDDASIRSSVLQHNQFCHSSILFRTAALIEHGKYDTTLSTCEDHDLILRIGKTWNFHTLPFYVTSHRSHTKNISGGAHARGRRLAMAKDSLNVTKRYATHYPNAFIACVKGYARCVWALR